MNYFELFGIPVQLKVNTAKLTSQFFALSKKYHPDYFANESNDAQAQALEQSAMLNKAWKTFQNPEETIRYVLTEKGLMEEEEKYELPADFLMEMMDINEALMDGDGTESAVLLNSTVAELQNDIYAPVKEVVENYQEGVTSEKELLQVKEYYYKKKYLDRIRHQLAGMA